MSLEFFGYRFCVHIPNGDELVLATSCYEIQGGVEARVVDVFGHPMTSEIMEYTKFFHEKSSISSFIHVLSEKISVEFR